MRNQEDEMIRAVRDKEVWEFVDEKEEQEYGRSKNFDRFKQRVEKREETL